MNIAIYIYDGAEVLDFSGPFEVFSTANRILSSRLPFNVFLIADKKSPVVARGGFQVLPFYNIDDHPPIDVLVVPGGEHDKELDNVNLLSWIIEVRKKANIITSVCTGAFILAETGILNDLTVTTHWEDLDDLEQTYPQLDVVRSQRWVDEGDIVTSGGISAGIDMSLHLVSRLCDFDTAVKTAKQMEYDWHDSDRPSDDAGAIS